MKATYLIPLLTTVASLPALAQSSPSYKLEDHTLNAGGRPEQGVVAGSASYRITLDSIGDVVVGRGLASASFHMDASFTPAYRPPGEVTGLRWISGSDLEWDADPAAGVYNVYRDPLGDLPGTHGECLAPDVATTSHTDMDMPPSGTGYFYLITVENRLREEGTRGMQSNGSPRSTLNACP